MPASSDLDKAIQDLIDEHGRGAVFLAFAVALPTELGIADFVDDAANVVLCYGVRGVAQDYLRMLETRKAFKDEMDGRPGNLLGELERGND